MLAITSDHCLSFLPYVLPSEGASVIASVFKAYSLPCLPSSKSASKPLPTPSTVFTLDNTSAAVYAEESNFVLTWVVVA